MFKRFAALVAVVVLCASLFSCVNEEPRARRTNSASRSVPSASTALTAEEEKMMRELIETNFVDRINPQMNEAWVNPLSWASLKYEDKKHLGFFLAKYCGKKKGTNLNWVEIYDVYSGKKLAKYSESWGFKVY